MNITDHEFMNGRHCFHWYFTTPRVFWGFGAGRSLAFTFGLFGESLDHSDLQWVFTRGFGLWLGSAFCFTLWHKAMMLFWVWSFYMQLTISD